LSVDTDVEEHTVIFRLFSLAGTPLFQLCLCIRINFIRTFISLQVWPWILCT